MRIGFSVMLLVLLVGCSGPDAGVDAPKAKPAAGPTPSASSPSSRNGDDSWSDDPSVKEARELFWEARKEEAKVEAVKQAYASPQCKMKEVHQWKDGRLQMNISWSNTDLYEASRWVYFDEQGNKRLVLSSFQKGQDRLEVRLYLHPNGDEVFYDERWISRESSTSLPLWNINRATVQEAWVPGC